MNPIKIFASFMLLLCSACSTSPSESHALSDSNHGNGKTPNFYDDSLTRKGKMSASQILAYPKFRAEYDSWQPDAKEIERFRMLVGNDMVVFFGLWCHDSQKNVARLIKLIQLSEFPMTAVEWQAVTPTKKIPQAMRNKFELTKTPTIFLLKNDQIIGKIVENPKLSLAQDLLQQVLH